MKTLILSDLHSNIVALETIWAKERDSDLVLCAGDLVDYGPYPHEVLGWVRERGVRCVQGNHDAWVALNYRQGNTLENVPAEERTWAHLNVSLLEEADIQFLENLPRTLAFEMDGIDYGMTHMYRNYEEIVSLHTYDRFREEAFNHAVPAGSGCDAFRLIMGHTHRQGIRFLADDRLWMNPGSISYRRKDDPDQTAHYATIIDGKISLKRLAYDITPLYHFVQTIRLRESDLAEGRFYFGPRG